MALGVPISGDPHRSVGGSFASILLPTGGNILSTLFVCLLPFPCHPPSESGLFLEQRVSPAAACPAGQTFPFTTFTASARKVMLAYLRCPSPGSAAFSETQSTHFRVYRWMDLLSFLVCWAEKHFCSIVDV